MPMLDLRGNIDNVSGGQCPCRFSVLLIPAASPRYKQDLSALVVDVPGVDRTGGKSHNADADAGGCKHIQIAFTRKILRVGSVFSSDGKNRAAAEFPLHSVCIHEDFSFHSQTSI